MVKLKFFLTIIFFIFLFKGVCYAGCLSAGGNIYITSSGTYMGAPYYNWNGTTSDANRINGGINTRCITYFTPRRNCYIRHSCGFFGCTYELGEEVNYGPLPCPIDDYIPFVILLTGGLGIVYLRKNKLNLV